MNPNNSDDHNNSNNNIFNTTDCFKKKVTFQYLKKGEGILASDYYKSTKFAKQRKEKIIKEQLEREKRII